MFYLHHNHDTSINTFAEQLSIRVKAIDDKSGARELATVKTNDAVQLVEFSLKDDIEKLISKIDNAGASADSFLPKILITKSHTVNATSYGTIPLKFAQQEVLSLVNISDPLDTIMLSGNWFEYDMPIQILILSRTGYANKELSLELLRILYEIKTIHYKLKIFDSTDPLAVHTVEDFGTVSIKDFEGKSFETTLAGEDNSIIINSIDFIMRENYFKLSDSKIYTTAQLVAEVR